MHTQFVQKYFFMYRSVTKKCSFPRFHKGFLHLPRRHHRGHRPIARAKARHRHAHHIMRHMCTSPHPKRRQARAVYYTGAYLNRSWPHHGRRRDRGGGAQSFRADRHDASVFAEDPARDPHLQPRPDRRLCPAGRVAGLEADAAERHPRPAIGLSRR